MIRIFKAMFSGIGTLTMLVIFLALVHFPQYIGAIDGRWSPVVSDLELEIKEYNEVAAEVEGQFFVRRPECTVDHIEWRLLTDTREFPAGIDYLDNFEVEKPGWNQFGPIVVDIGPEKLKERSVAVIYHNCPWRPWKTVTRFYP